MIGWLRYRALCAQPESALAKGFEAAAGRTEAPHSAGGCLLCAGEDFNPDFDYCRACGRRSTWGPGR